MSGTSYIINYSEGSYYFQSSCVENHKITEMKTWDSYPLKKSDKTVFGDFNQDGSGGGHGYTTISTHLMITARRQHELLEEQKLWTQRAEIQDLKDALELDREINYNGDLINFLLLECNIPEVIDEFIEFESECLQDDKSCVICGCSCSSEIGNHHNECLQDLDLNIT